MRLTVTTIVVAAALAVLSQSVAFGSLREVEKGVFIDNFEEGRLDGWKVEADHAEIKKKSRNAVLELGADGLKHHTLWLAGKTFKDFSIEVDIRRSGFGSPCLGVVFRNGCRVVFRGRPATPAVELKNGKRVARNCRPGFDLIGRRKLKVVCAGPIVRVSVDGVQACAYDAMPTESGPLGLYASRKRGNFDNVKIRAEVPPEQYIWVQTQAPDQRLVFPPNREFTLTLKASNHSRAGTQVVPSLSVRRWNDEVVADARGKQVAIPGKGRETVDLSVGKMPAGYYKLVLEPGGKVYPLAIEQPGSGKRVAAIVTEYRRGSHAEAIVNRFLEGYDIGGVYHDPRVRIASLYTDQVPGNDISREIAARHGVPIYPTIAEALTCGGRTLAVDGVLLVAEHGDYPHNEKGQKMYPKRRFFEVSAALMHASGRVVPVFCDKHLSTTWEDARWTYDTARKMRIPFMAGSSLPVTVRVPPLELPLGCEIEEALVVGQGLLEAYGIHALETLQCMVERRKGGETGVARVRCLQGDAMWKAMDAGEWSKELMDLALSRIRTRRGSPREYTSKDTGVYQIEYRDGFRATVLMLGTYTGGFAFAARLKGQNDPVSTRFDLYQLRENFPRMVRHLEEMFLTGQVQYPVERTLLTTGVLEAILDSRSQGQVWLKTPHLDVRYGRQPSHLEHPPSGRRKEQNR